MPGIPGSRDSSDAGTVRCIPGATGPAMRPAAYDAAVNDTSRTTNPSKAGGRNGPRFDFSMHTYGRGVPGQ